MAIIAVPCGLKIARQTRKFVSASNLQNIGQVYNSRMRAVDLIIKKRDGGELSKEEIVFFINGFTHGQIPDYQASAWAMAVLMKGMSDRETFDLTQAMVDSGEVIDLGAVVPFAVDKHSTGGVGDKTSLVVLPIVAATGLSIGKMSGKGLSFTGGTLDKMESIPGYRIDLSKEEFISQLKDVGIVLTGQSVELAPADGKLYALRDVTGTVPSIPLIAASIMSKKIAAGADAIVLDVKVGVGAFMRDEQEGTRLARALVDTGRRAGKRVVALISDMNQPLGNAVGNAIEVQEAIETLNGEGPEDFQGHCIEVAGHMITLAEKSPNLDDGKKLAAKSLSDGSALLKFRQLVEAQGGDVNVIDDVSLLPLAPIKEAVPSPESGYISAIHARQIGMTAMLLGAGRAMKEDPVDYGVGLVVHNKVGDAVEKGDALFTVFANDEKNLDEATRNGLAAHQFSTSPVDRLPLFYATIAD